MKSTMLFLFFFLLSISSHVVDMDYLMVFQGSSEVKGVPVLSIRGVTMVIRMNERIMKNDFLEFYSKIVTRSLKNQIGERYIFSELFQGVDFYQFEDGYHWISQNRSVSVQLPFAFAYYFGDGIQSISQDQLKSRKCLKNRFGTESDNTIIGLERTISKDGFHRLLNTKVTFSKQIESGIVHLHDLLPRGIYIDEFELEKYYPHLSVNVRNYGRIDIEKPKIFGEPVHIEVGISGNEVSSSNVFTISYPIHIRYHPPGNNTHEYVNLSPAVVFLERNDIVSDHESFFRCSIGKDIPSFPTVFIDGRREVLEVKVEMIDEVGVQIPIGQIREKTMVTYLTLTVTTISTLVLAFLVFLG